jgi:hypothetical protein
MPPRQLALSTQLALLLPLRVFTQVALVLTLSQFQLARLKQAQVALVMTLSP